MHMTCQVARRHDTVNLSREFWLILSRNLLYLAVVYEEPIGFFLGILWIWSTEIHQVINLLAFASPMRSENSFLVLHHMTFSLARSHTYGRFIAASEFGVKAILIKKQFFLRTAHVLKFVVKLDVQQTPGLTPVFPDANGARFNRNGGYVTTVTCHLRHF